MEYREEKWYALTETDKKRIVTLTKDNDIYEKLFSIIGNLPHTQQDLEKIRNRLDSYINEINIMEIMKIKNFTKYGFSDAMNLILECVNQK